MARGSGTRGSSGVWGQVPPVVRTAKTALRDKVVEQHLTGGGAHAEQPGGLVDVQAESGHLAERAEHHQQQLSA
jgi:hypothetical protein